MILRKDAAGLLAADPYGLAVLAALPAWVMKAAAFAELV